MKLYTDLFVFLMNIHYIVLLILVKENSLSNMVQISKQKNPKTRMSLF